MQNRTKALCIIVLFVAVLGVASPVSANGDESPQSITFCETLPDDVLFYPDKESHGSGFAESFADVSDVTYHSDMGLDPGEYSISSDGDIATIEITCNDAGNEWVIYEIVPSSLSVENYIEFSYRIVATDAIAYVFVEGTTGKVWPLYGGVSETFVTIKVWIPSLGAITGDITCIGIYCNDNTDAVDSGTPQTQWDYLRVGPADEMGFSHDGSTTAGISSSDGGTISSNGDKIILTADADGATFIIVADTTATASMISTTYYPMLHLKITGGSSTWSLEQYDGSAYATLQSSTSLTTGAKRFNMQALDTYVEKWRITLSNSGTLIFDFLQAYSIANFTVIQSGVDIDDYLYVDSGVLYSNIDDGYIEANHDPTLNLSQYHDWNMDTSLGTPEIDFYDDVWLGYSTETEGEFLIGSIVTDFRLKFTDNANIISLEFSVMAELELSIFEELFLSTEMWGYFGPLGLVIIGYLLIKKDKALGIFMFIVDCLVIAHYLTLVGATPAYWWHIFILLFGVIQCTIQLLDR